jgi:hypothetical protein
MRSHGMNASEKFVLSIFNPLFFSFVDVLGRKIHVNNLWFKFKMTIPSPLFFFTDCFVQS